MRLEKRARATYPLPMDDTPHRTQAVPAGWLEALAESEAELDAGVATVPAELVHQQIHDSIARMRAKRADERKVASPR
jgi:hypothetical protein